MKKNKITRCFSATLLSLLLIAAMLGGLTGCSGSDVPAAADSQTSLEAAQSTEEKTLPAETDDAGTTSGDTDGTVTTSGDTDGTVTTSAETDGAGTASAEESTDVGKGKAVGSDPKAGTTEASAEAGSSFRVHFIDVGQADAALIQCDGHYMLIDGGNADDSNVIYTYLKKQNVDRLDYIVCTHAHEDHVGGLAGALNYTSAETVLCPVTSHDTKVFQNFVKYLGNTPITVPSVGDAYTLGSAAFTILGPVNSGEDTNDTSIVLRLVYGKTSFLFAGDAGDVEEHDILELGLPLESTVLKVGHHGSSTSTCYRWLRAIDPEYAVISVGQDNSYGHPAEDLLSRLRDADVKTYRTDLQGDIICTSDGNGVRFTVARNDGVDTLFRSGNTGASGTSEKSTGTASKETEKTPDPDGSEAERTYICNVSTKKFHDPDCASVNRMADRNKREIICSRQELIDEGYSPCGICSP